MAVTLTAAPVTSFCGSLGATTAQKAASSPRLRLRWPIYTRVLNNNLGKVRIAARVKNLAAAYAFLSSPTVDLWTEYALTADPIYNCPGVAQQPNSWQVFLALNLNLLAAGHPPITTPPTSTTTTTLTSVSWTIDATTQVLRLNSVTPTIASDELLMINVSGRKTSGTTAIPKSIAHLTNGPDGSSGPIDFTAAWIAAHGTLKPTGQLALEVRCLSTSSAKYSPGLKSLQTIL